MSLAAFLRTVVQVLDNASIDYMLTGSLAAAFYAVPRATQDIDLVLETEERGVGDLVRGLLLVGWYVDEGAAVIIAKLEWSRLGDSALQRRDVAQLLERTWLRLDQAYLGRWIGELNLESEWRAAVSQAGQSPT